MRKTKIGPTLEERQLAKTWIELVDMLDAAMPIDDIAQRWLDDIASLAALVRRIAVALFAKKLSRCLDDETRTAIVELRDAVLTEIDRFFARKESAVYEWEEDQRLVRRYIRLCGRITFHGSGCVTSVDDEEKQRRLSCWRDPIRDLNERVLRA
jgi:hypothetical protein